MKNLNKNGVTLTEVMVTTIIFTFMMAGLYTTLLAGRVSWQSYEAAVKAQREVRNAIAVMSRDMRVANNVLPSAITDGLLVSFSLPGEGTVNYTWATSGAQANRIIRQNSTATRIIANDITAFSINGVGNEITMDVSATVHAVQGHDNHFRLVKKVAKR